jgi:hypothetical protein
MSLAESLGLNFSNPEFDIHDDPQLQEAFETLQQVSMPLDDIINKSLSRQKYTNPRQRNYPMTSQSLELI